MKLEHLLFLAFLCLCGVEMSAQPGQQMPLIVNNAAIPYWTSSDSINRDPSSDNDDNEQFVGLNGKSVVIPMEESSRKDENPAECCMYALPASIITFMAIFVAVVIYNALHGR